MSAVTSFFFQIIYCYSRVAAEIFEANTLLPSLLGKSYHLVVYFWQLCCIVRIYANCKGKKIYSTICAGHQYIYIYIVGVEVQALSFLGALQHHEKRLLTLSCLCLSVCLSICPRGTTQLPPDGFS